jgi:hypothetical protein
MLPASHCVLAGTVRWKNKWLRSRAAGSIGFASATPRKMRVIPQVPWARERPYGLVTYCQTQETRMVRCTTAAARAAPPEE